MNGTTFSVRVGQRVCLLGESGAGKSLTASSGARPPPLQRGDRGQHQGQRHRGARACRPRSDQRRPASRWSSRTPPSRSTRWSASGSRSSSGSSAPRTVAGGRAAGGGRAGGVGRAARPARMLDRFSAELSGGQRQRICIALALACPTRLMVADEPTTALDVVTQKRVLDVLKKYTAGQHTPALLFITHDFAVASELCSDSVVMKDGNVVEQGEVHSIFAAPEDPYTREIIRAAQAATVDPYIQKFRERARRAAGRGCRRAAGAGDVLRHRRGQPCLRDAAEAPVRQAGDEDRPAPDNVDDRRGRAHGHRRHLGLRQDDPAAPHARARHDRRRCGDLRGQGGASPPRSASSSGTAGRCRTCQDPRARSTR